MTGKVLLWTMLILLPLGMLGAQEGPSLTEDLAAMAGLYAAGDYQGVVGYTAAMKNHLSGEVASDPFYRDLALFLLWASRIETGDSATVTKEMAYYFKDEGQTEFHSLPPLMSAFLYHDLLLDSGDAAGADALAESILAIPDYSGTIQIWASAGDAYGVVTFGTPEFLESLERRRGLLVPEETAVTWSVESADPRPPEGEKSGAGRQVFNTVETLPLLAVGGNFFIRREPDWLRVYWSHTFASERQARDTGKALVRDGVIDEFLVKQEPGTGRWIIQVGALKSEKTALEWEKKLEGRSGGSR